MFNDNLRDIINSLRSNESKRSLHEFITLQSHAKGRPPLERDCHDIVMAYADIALLAIFVIRELKAQNVKYETVANNMRKIIREHPKLLKWLWDNEDCYFCRITKNDLIVREYGNKAKENNL